MRIILAALLTLAACEKTSVTRHGEPLSGTEPVSLSSVIANPDSYAGKRLVVDGKVRAACTKKGCWMELAPTVEKGSPGCRVTFKDYGFFVPVDSAGATARVDGQLEVRTIEPQQVAHLEGEGATFAAKSPDGSARELRLVATGVELRRKLN